MNPETVRLVSARRLQAMESSLRRLRWSVSLLSCLAIVLMGVAASRVSRIAIPPAAQPAEASIPLPAPEERIALAVLEDPLYDQFLQEYDLLRNDAERRRYLVAQVVVAAAAHRLDPDLLFALIATESSFDSDAVSPKGARGLGQMVFATARAVAPAAVRQPEDLHDVPRNLYATALHLAQLLGEQDGDVREALGVYYSGSADRSRSRPDRAQYVARVATFYAYLKAKRAHDHLVAATDDEGKARVR
jgi:soluble lytic murein transglycosylase-like protein